MALVACASPGGGGDNGDCGVQVMCVPSAARSARDDRDSGVTGAERTEEWYQKSMAVLRSTAAAIWRKTEKNVSNRTLLTTTGTEDPQPTDYFSEDPFDCGFSEGRGEMCWRHLLLRRRLEWHFLQHEYVRMSAVAMESAEGKLKTRAVQSAYARMDGRGLAARILRARVGREASVTMITTKRCPPSAQVVGCAIIITRHPQAGRWCCLPSVCAQRALLERPAS